MADRHHVFAASPEWVPQSPFVQVADRLRADPAWVVHDLDETHDALRNGPDALLGVLDPIIGR